MGELLIDKGEARKFLREVAKAYNSLGVFSRFEMWAKDYRENKKYLGKVVEYLQERNSKGNSRIFTMSDSTIEDILKTIPLKDS